MNEKSKTILEKLLEKTKAKEIEWHATSTSNEFKFQFENGSALTIFSKTSASLENYYAFILYNSDGTRVDSDLVYSTRGELYQLLKSLYGEIQKRTRKEDETYDDIFKELGL